MLTNCKQLKMTAADGKKYNNDVANTEQLLRLIQSMTEISKERAPQTFEENRAVARSGGEVAGIARIEAEKRIGKSVITAKNAGDFSNVISNVVDNAKRIEGKAA